MTDISLSRFTRIPQIHIRSIEAWYGSAFDGATAVISDLELTDLVSEGVASGSAVNFSDPRVTSNLGPWVDNSVNDLEWVCGDPEGVSCFQPPPSLAAEQNLRAALAAVLDAPAFAAPIDRGTQEYLIQTWDTECAGAPGFVGHFGYARVRYVELNAYDLGTCDPCASWKNHGQYVSCVAHAVNALVKHGVLTRNTGDELVSSAAQSQIGKKGYVPPECP